MRWALGWVVRKARGSCEWVKGKRRSLAYSLLGGLCVGAVAAVVWWLPKWQVAYLVGSVSPGELFQRETEARQTWAGIIGGLVVLGTLYFTWRRVEVAQEGQITERFTRAIEQLGSEKLEVRLGGIYALERIARDSEKDHWPIMEVLTAYVRENAEWTEDSPEEAPPLGADIQAILSVIVRRRRDVAEEWLNLSATDLRRCSLVRARLDRLHLVSAHMEASVLSMADLRGCYLLEAHLGRSNLFRADLRGVELPGVDLGGTDLMDADLSGARLSGDLFSSAANLSGAEMYGANLVGAHLQGVEGLTREQIAEAITDETTVLPSYLKEEGEKGEGEEGADG